MASAETFVSELKHLFLLHANQEDAQDMARYMKHKFAYFGIRSPQRKELTRAFLKQYPAKNIQLDQLVKLLWTESERELQYVGTELMQKYIKKQDADFIKTIEWLVLHKSWWDTVDFLGPLAGTLFVKHQNLLPSTTDAWIQSENMWLNRAALLFQLKYGGKTDFNLLKSYILLKADHPDFFIMKAIGWVLRQYSKYNPTTVQTFIEGHTDVLSPLSQREGMKHILRR